jgi:hypothetical protein
VNANSLSHVSCLTIYHNLAMWRYNFGQQQRRGLPPKSFFRPLRYPDTKARGLRVPRFLFRYAITLPMSAKRMKGRWVVYERRNGEFIFLSRLFTTRAQAEMERDKLKATFTYKVSLGVGAIAKK